MIYKAELENIPTQSAMTFSGWFKFDNLTQNKDYPLFSIKTTKVYNVDDNLTTYDDLFKVYFEKKDALQQIVIQYEDSSVDKKTNVL